jgi:hypothetical protein
VISIKRLRRKLNWGPDRDADLVEARQAAVDLWESATGRLWAYREDYEVNLAATVERTLWLPLFPVEELSLLEGSSPHELDEVSEDDYSFSAATGSVSRLRGSNWSGHLRAVVTGGYAEDAAPGDVLRAIELQAMFDLTRNSVESLAASGKSVGRGSISFVAGDMHPAFKTAAQIHMRMF